MPSANHACAACDPPKKAHGKKGVLGIIVHVIALLAFGGIGVGLQKCSFSKVAEIRQLARVPKTDVQAAVPGEINLSGSAVQVGPGDVIKAPDTKHECLFYRYLVEREERDSDGDTRWVTETDRSSYVPRFILRDKTGDISIRPSDRAKFNVPSSHKRKSGNRRYTEFRLDPSDQTFIFGYAEPDVTDTSGKTLFVGFDRPGDYQPLISEKTELKERTGRVTSSIIACWGGLVLIGATMVVLFSLTGRHRLLVYFWVLSMAIGAVLVFLGIAMMRSDLKIAHEHILRQDKTVNGVVTAALKDKITWDGDWLSLGDFAQQPELEKEEVERLRRVRIDLAAGSRRVSEQAEKFPYSLIAGTLDLEGLPEVPLPDADEAQLLELESSFQKAKLSGWATWLWGIGGLAGTFLATWFGFRSVKLKRMTEALPTSPTKGVAYGLTELKGVIDLPEGIDPMQGPVSNKPCVTFKYTIEERRGHGKKARWVQIHNEDRRCAFVCRDAEGTFPIDPDGADIMSWRKDSRREGRLRYNETRLQFGDPLYAIGTADIDPDTGDSLYMRKPDPKDEPFVLSSFTEKAVIAKRGIRAIAWMTLAFGSVLLAGLMLFASRGAFSPSDYLAAAMVGPAYLCVLTFILHYNDLVFLRQRARRNWSNIEVSLRKRYDLIPSMIQIAKAYMQHETDVHTGLAKLRESYGGGAAINPNMASEMLQEGHMLGGAIMGLVENYPELQAQTQTAIVIRQMVALEDEIAFMRAGYNDAVTQYNTRIAKFPDSILAKIGKFLPMDLLEYDAEVVPMPVIAQETWRRKQVADEAKAEPEPDGQSEDSWPATPLPVPDPEAPVADATAERVFLYATLLDEVGDMRTKQLDLIRKEEGEIVAQAVEAQVESVQKIDPWARLSAARAAMPSLRVMTADAYLHFKGVARLLIEADDRINTYEYAFEKAIAYLIDPVFTPPEEPEIRHTSRETLKWQLDLLKDHISDPAQEQNLGIFDDAVEKIYHATAAVRSELYLECHESFAGPDRKPDSMQYVLLQALADGLFLKLGD